MYCLADELEKNATEDLGILSIDENQEVWGVLGDSFEIKFGQVRWHGQLSGLHILGRNPRKDDRMDGGIWYDFGRYVAYFTDSQMQEIAHGESLATLSLSYEIQPCFRC